MYNAWGESQKALEFLDRVHAINLKFEALKDELAFLHNCLVNYSQTIGYIMILMKEEPVTAYLIKEPVYTHVNNGNLVEAENIYALFDAKDADKKYQAENAYNILYGYNYQNGRVNFYCWLKASGLRTDPNFQVYVEQMI